MPVLLQTTLLLICSNVFMTFAWYAHLKDMSGRPWFIAALVSWGVALAEYLLQVPANRIGAEHPLTADVGCRNTLWSAVPQSGAEVGPALLERGVRHFRVELLDEPAAEIARIVTAYRGLLAGRTTGREVWKALNAANRVGVTRGTLEAKRNPLALL